MSDTEQPDDTGSRAAGAAAVTLVVIAACAGVLLASWLLTGCGSALADQCEAIYAGADSPEKLLAADAACLADGGAP